MASITELAFPSIAVLLADVDGTLVTKEKVITDRAVQAVRRMKEMGIIFTVTSGRPPRGMRMLVEPLGLTMPMAAFNGGVMTGYGEDLRAVVRKRMEDMMGVGAAH